MAWRAAIYKALPRIDPSTIDALPLPVLGALLGNDMVDPTAEEEAAADELVASRARRAQAGRQRLVEQGILPPADSVH